MMSLGSERRRQRLSSETTVVRDSLHLSCSLQREREVKSQRNLGVYSRVPGPAGERRFPPETTSRLASRGG
jgi:hypothetical protein